MADKERIAELEARLRQSEAHDRERQSNLLQAHQELIRLRLGAAEADSRARLAYSSAVTTASTLEEALRRLERYEPVIVAAREWARDPTRVNRIFALGQAVTTLDDGKRVGAA